MKIQPQNRHLLVEVLETKNEDKPTILVPDDYAVRVVDEHQLVRILSAAPDSTLFEPGQCAVVEGHMVKSVKVGGDLFHLVLENYVLALVEDEAV
jgi:hypothetical protein